MQNLSKMKRMARNGKEKGFTIIELVVVILLLGILTATALPRFIDVTDEARDAVRDATAGGLRTGMALYRAAVIAGDVQSGSAPTATSDYTLLANASGYPSAGNGCSAIYAGLLQVGATTASAAVDGVGAGGVCNMVLTEVSRTLQFSVNDGSVN